MGSSAEDFGGDIRAGDTAECRSTEPKMRPNMVRELIAPEFVWGYVRRPVGAPIGERTETGGLDDGCSLASG